MRTVVDLRYRWEIDSAGRVPEYDGLAYHNLSIEHRPYDQAALAPDTDPVRFLADRYAEVAADGVKEIRQVLEVLAAETSAPAVIHCSAGKDRTGLVAALVLALLGVAEDDIVADFALTERATDGLIADWRAANPGRPLRWLGYGRAPAELMRLFRAELAARHGSVHAYAANQLGVDDELITALRRQLLSV